MNSNSKNMLDCRQLNTSKSVMCSGRTFSNYYLCFSLFFFLLLFMRHHAQTTKAFLPAMLEKDHGHIVTIASLAGHVGITKLVDYCSSKYAAVGFDEAIRLELQILGSQNVLTTCICPFFIQSTGMFDDVNSRSVLDCRVVTICMLR